MSSLRRILLKIQMVAVRVVELVPLVVCLVSLSNRVQTPDAVCLELNLCRKHGAIHHRQGKLECERCRHSQIQSHASKTMSREVWEPRQDLTEQSWRRFNSNKTSSRVWTRLATENKQTTSPVLAISVRCVSSLYHRSGHQNKLFHLTHLVS